MGQYTSYWLYQKYEKRGDQDWLPTYPNVWSVDGDGSMSLIKKIDNDPACGYDPHPEVQYRWVNIDPSVDYYCEECSVDPSVKIYRWNKAPATDYACSGTTKMYKEYYQYSTDGGTTWQNVIPVSSRTSDTVIEYNSEDCGYIPTGTTLYRWVRTDNTICIETGPFENQYLTIVANSSGIVKKTNHNETFYYSKNNGSWLSGNSSTSISVSSGDKIRFKGPINPGDASSTRTGVGIFNTTCSFKAEGNPMSLLYGDNFSGQTSLVGECGFDFYSLFGGCTGLTSIDNLVLPATAMTNYCYMSMFNGCTSLKRIPYDFLPATTLGPNCYEGMFNGCTSLTSIPSGLLPATNLVGMCYMYMFADCTSLTSIPSGLLPSKTLDVDCYHGMFDGCTSLTSIPSGLLPAKTIAVRSYKTMFAGCTSLTTVPSDLLPATTLDVECYGAMFYGCSSLTEAPDLPASKLLMGSIPRSGSYDAMFGWCTSLNKVTCLATNPNKSYETFWLGGVSQTGTFYKKAGVSWPRGEDGIPSGWTVVEI